MSAYLDLITRLARQFENISITQRSRNDLRHADALAYLSAAIECNEPRNIVVEFKEEASIHIPVKSLTEAYFDCCIFYRREYDQDSSPSFIKAVFTRKRRREMEDEGSRNATLEPDAPKFIAKEDGNDLPISSQSLDGNQSESDHEADDSPEVPIFDIELLGETNSEDDWWNSYMEYIQNGTLPDDSQQATKIKKFAWRRASP
ncbi:hypothetical protein FRX31_026040 [Thalictrum thalictroides]|uniref:Uncharacterized protein n=1 Tax=Thalictrum thalictroides TaxID=46969 RepID=A0A7J6VI21_THATH|nr:hypothetical protein FRX31_026040 [Thalictrum thalictroides]